MRGRPARGEEAELGSLLMSFVLSSFLSPTRRYVIYTCSLTDVLFDVFHSVI